MATGSASVNPSINPEAEIQKCVAESSVVKSFRAAEATESRFVYKLGPDHVSLNLVAGSLAGPEQLSAPPVVFMDRRAGKVLAFYYLGRKLCGHVGWVHGGMTATLLDEIMGAACSLLLPLRVAVTATLDLIYLQPMPTDCVYAVHAETERKEGNMAWVNGWIEDIKTGKKTAEAKGFFVQPKDADKMAGMV